MHTVREGEWRQYFESRDILLLVNERHQLGCERDVISSCVASAVECLVRLYRMRPFRREKVDELMSYPEFLKTLREADLKVLPRAYRPAAELLKRRLYRLTDLYLRLLTRR